MKPHLEEGQGDPEQDLGALQEQNVPDAHSRLSRQGGAEQAAKPAPSDLLRSATLSCKTLPSYWQCKHVVICLKHSRTHTMSGVARKQLPER